MKVDKFTIAVLIASYNRCAKTLKCIERIYSNEFSKDIKLSIILVDDLSTDDTISQVSNHFPEVKIIMGNGTLYWSGGMRLAFSTAMHIGFDAYIWLNDDTYLYPNAIHTLYSDWLKLEDDAKNPVIVVGSTQDPITEEHTYGGVVSENKLRPFRYQLVPPNNIPVECKTMNGNCVFIPANVANQVGNISDIFSHGMGDTDYGLRASKAKVKIFIATGFIGICSLNLAKNTFKDKTLSAINAWKKMMEPKGLPPRAWLVFTFRHAGFFWPIYWIWPYLKFLLIFFRHRS